MGQQKDTTLVQLEAAKMTKKKKKNLVTTPLPENDPDSAATLSTTVSVQEADTKAGAEKSVRFAMRM